MGETRAVVSEIDLDRIDRLESLTPADVLWRAVEVANEEGPVYLASGGEPVGAIVSLDFIEAAPDTASLRTPEDPVPTEAGTGS